MLHSQHAIIFILVSNHSKLETFTHTNIPVGVIQNITLTLYTNIYRNDNGELRKRN